MSVKSVLVVDDEPVIRDVVAEALREEGYAVTTARDGRMALDLLAQQPPDLVVMDVMMPGMNGRDAFLAMRSRRDLPSVPVIMMSAAIGTETLDPSISGFLPKPFDLDDLVVLVEQLIGRPRGC